MRLWRALTRRMVVKIFFAVAVSVLVALGAFAWRQSSEQVRSLNEGTTRSAQQVADLVAGGVEHAMLAGDGLEVKKLIGTFGKRVPSARVHVFDRRGFEVFHERGPAPAAGAIPGHVAETLAGAPRRALDDGTVVRPIAHEERCAACHPGPGALRGVLAFRPATQVLRDQRARVLPALVRAAFVSIMTGTPKGKIYDTVGSYLGELSQAVPGIRAASVYDRDGVPTFGIAIPGAGEAEVAPALAPGAGARSLAAGGGSIELIPMPLEDRCRDCHKEEDPVRGVLVVSLAAPDPAAAPTAELEAAIDVSLRHIMLSRLGRMIAMFLDGVAATGAASDLAVYDDAGRLFYTTGANTPLPVVGAVLDTAAPALRFEGAGANEWIVVAQPLPNKKECQRCHGASEELRGVVLVSLRSEAAGVRAMAMQRTLMFSALALLAIVVILYALLQWLVVRPVAAIGTAAEKIGKGQLDVRVDRANPEGDEVQRLGSRINDMVHGLRTKLVLERFVSRGTAEAASGAARSTSARVAARSGERRAATVVFTDIRGFTAYSETVSPEQVVEMLNRFLQAQADVVDKHGGDIDKYVGDELMAVFEGPEGTAEAVRAAIDMVDAVERTRKPGETLHVGAGVSHGEMVHGPIGSENRMDFTVIGDVVNVGARLCSQAAPGQVIVSGAVRDACAGAADLAFEPLTPLQLKGKREPFPVFAAKRRAV